MLFFAQLFEIITLETSMTAGGRAAVCMDEVDAAELPTAFHHYQHQQQQHGGSASTEEPIKEVESPAGLKMEQESSLEPEPEQEPECHLEHDQLWQEFHRIGTEMIITRAGRCAH